MWAKLMTLTQTETPTEREGERERWGDGNSAEVIGVTKTMKTK